jgi:hypothetical protein
MEITDYLTKCVEQDIPVTFLKFGDGEYNCVFQPVGANCDRDLFTLKLSNSLKESFQYMIENTDNTYIGKWHDLENAKKWEELVTKKVNWVNYHSIIIDNININNDSKIKLYKTIKMSKTKKIIVCNELLIKSKYLLDIDYVIIIPLHSWFDTYFENVMQQITSLIGIDENHIVITCCGMSAKVLLTELRKKFKKGVYLDFGSALDLICTKKDSRRYSTYESVEYLYSDLFSSNWNDSVFENIYESAKINLGVHLHR